MRLGSFTTQALARGQVAARMVAQDHYWWSIFLWLSCPGKHLESIYSHRLLLYAIGNQTQHSGQTMLIGISTHPKAWVVQAILTWLSRFFR